jgi:hypothetical protein
LLFLNREIRWQWPPVSRFFVGGMNNHSAERWIALSERDVINGVEVGNLDPS